MTSKEQEWREEFEIYAKLNSHTGRKYYTNANDYEVNSVQLRWLDYLAARKKAQEELEVHSNKAMDEMISMNTERQQQLAERDALIKEAIPWVEDYNCNHISDFIGDEKAELFQRSVYSWIEKAQKLTGDKK